MLDSKVGEKLGFITFPVGSKGTEDGHLKEVSSGTIRVGENDVTQSLASERGMSLLFQNLALYPHMTVEENMRYTLEIENLPTDEIQRRVQDAAEQLQIDAHLDRYPRELSGGQQQHVAIGREIIREPKAFLMDEPLSDLDAKLQIKMRGQSTKSRTKLGSQRFTSPTIRSPR